MSIAATFEIEYLQYLDAEGKHVRDDLPEFAKDLDQLVELYKLMLSCACSTPSRSPCSAPASSAPMLAASATKPRTWHRQRDAPRRRVRADVSRIRRAVLSRREAARSATCTGAATSAATTIQGAGPHDFAWSVPIATQCLHAAGAALAFKIRKEPRVAGHRVGDGGSSKGDFYGAINVAGAMNLPLVAVIVNNQWAISVPRKIADRRRRRSRRRASPRACTASRSTATTSSPCARRSATRSSAHAHGHGGTRDRSGDVSPVRSHHRRRRAPLSSARRK